MRNKIKTARPSRYELSHHQWERIEPLLPRKAGDPGRTTADNRLFINGVLWVLRPEARWSYLPARYGRYKSVHSALPDGRPAAYGNVSFRH